MVNTITLSAGQRELIATQSVVPDRDWSPAISTLPEELHELRQRILAEIDHAGLVIVGTFAGDPNAVLYQLMSLVGTPFRDEHAGPMIMDLKPIKHEMSVETTSYYSWNQFDYHTDLSYVDAPPDFIAVLCVNPDARGQGASIFSDIRTCAADLDQQTMRLLQQPLYRFKSPPHYRGGATAVKPILTRNAQGELNLRVRFDRASAASPEAEQALQVLSAALDSHRVEFLLERNTAYLVDNLRVAHGRTPFSPSFTEGDRHLKRILGRRSSA